MRQTTFWLAAKDGVQIFTRTWLPDASPKGAVQIAHGMCEHSERYARLAQALVAAGYAVYASDMRGHGHTAKTPGDLGHLADQNGWNLVLSDLLCLTETIHQQHPNIPVFLIGHSMGSFLAQHYITRHADTIKGAVFSGTNGKVGPLLWAGKCTNRFEMWRQGPKGRSALMEYLSFGAYNNAFKPTRTAFDWITRDPAEVDKYISDPLCGFRCTNQFWSDLIEGLEAIEKPKNIAHIPKEFPVLMVSGSLDPVSNKTAGVQRLIATYQNASLRDITYHFYEGARHEVFNETNREEVYRNVIDWLECLARE